MTTSHSVRLQAWSFFAADFTHKVRHHLRPGGAFEIGPQPGIFQCLLRVFHEFFYQLLLLPPTKSQQYSRRLWGQAKNLGNIVDLDTLFAFDIHGVQNLEFYLIGFPLLFNQVFVIGETGIIEVIKINYVASGRQQTTQDTPSWL